MPFTKNQTATWPRPTKSCVDCGAEDRPMMCPACAERLAEDIIEYRLEDDKPQLGLYEVTVYPQGSTARTVHVLVLAKGPTSAEINALKTLGMADPGGRMRIGVSEIKGPFTDGSVLSVKES